MSFIIRHLEGNSRVLPVSLANTVQDPRVLPVPLEDIKQRHLEQLPVPPVSLVSQDLPIRPVLVALRRIGRVRLVVHVPLADGEVLPVRQR
jgi:hypothetical protein